MSKKMSFKRVLLCVLFIMASVIGVSASNNNDSIIIENVIDAIVYVESRGNINAVNGQCCGPMQISPGMVTACNNILKKHGSSIRYTLKDRFNLEKSKEMFRIFNKEYNPSFNMEKAIRSWNGGLGYKIASTNKYYNLVMKRYNIIRSTK